MIKQKKLFSIGLVAMLVLFSSCASRYHVSGIERSRILIDSRYDAQPDTRAEAILAPYKARVDSVMAPVVGTTDSELTPMRPEGKLSNLLPDILIWAAKDYGEHPDLAVYNIGGMRAALPKGKVTYGDVVDVAPFENKICFLTLSGTKLMELFSQIAFRGGEGVSHGVQLEISKDGKLLSATLHGKPIDPAAHYRVATIDYLSQGNDEMVAFKSGTKLVSPQSERNNMRYIICDYFRTQAANGLSVTAKIEGRIVIK